MIYDDANSDFDFLKLIFRLAQSQVVRNNICYMLRLDGRVEAHQLEVIMIKCHQVLAPLALLALDHAIALILNLVLRNNLIAVLEQLRDLQLSLLRPKRVVMDIWAVLCNQVEVLNVTLAELVDILNSEANNAYRTL